MKVDCGDLEIINAYKRGVKSSRKVGSLYRKAKFSLEVTIGLKFVTRQRVVRCKDELKADVH